MEFENWLEDTIYWTRQYIEEENIYYLVEQSVEEGILTEEFFNTKEELDNYIIERGIQLVKII